MGVTERCTSEWKAICKLEEKESVTDAETAMLAGLKIKFNLVLCVNYHQSKLVPYWGMSAQPGCTYFLQKLGP